MNFYEFNPTEKQKQFLQNPAKYKLFGGSMGSGKTIVLCAEVIRLALMFPKNRILFARHEYKSFKQSTLIELEDMLPTELIKKKNMADGEIVLTNGSTILLSGLENKDKIKSYNLGAFAIDEMTETSEDIFNMLMSRLRLNTVPNDRRFGMGASNPEPGWVKDRFVDPYFEKKERKNHAFIPALPQDNPYLPEDYIDGLKENYPPLWITKYLEGSWDVFDSQIFKPDFIIKSDPLPIDFDEIFVAVDPAITEKDDEKIDESAIVVMGASRDGLIHEIECRHGRWGIHDLVLHCKDVYFKYRPSFFGVEKVGFQDALRQLLVPAGVNAMPIKVDSDKVRRAYAVSYLFEQGRVRINNQVLVKQLLEFPEASKHGGHEDILDAMVHALTLYIKYSTPTAEKKEDKYKDLKPHEIEFWEEYYDRDKPKKLNIMDI